MTDQYTGPDRRTQTDTHWTFKKEVQIGQIISIAVFAITGLLYITKMDQRIAIIEDKVVAQKDRDAGQDKQFSETIAHMANQVDKMDSKLDRLVERSIQGK